MREKENSNTGIYNKLKTQELDLETQLNLAIRAQQGDLKARDELIYSCIGIVQIWARHYRISRYPLEDSLQDGFKGLLEAIRKFRTEYGIKFSTHAFHQVRGAIQRNMRVYTTETEAPKTLNSEIKYMRDESSPDPAEEVEEADMNKTRSERIKKVIDLLPKKHQQIIISYFGLQDNPQENIRTIAQRIGVSKSTAYNLFNRAIELLKEYMKSDTLLSSNQS